MTLPPPGLIEGRTTTRPHIAYTYLPGAADAPVVVLLHSLAMDHTMWASVADVLATGVTLITIDTRGHGQSERTGVVAPADWVDDITRVLDELQIARATLVGVSMGGMQAIAFAGSRPERTAAIVVADSYLSLPSQISHDRIAAQRELARVRPMTDVADEYVTATILDTASPAADLVRSVIGRMTAADYLAAVTSCFSADVSAWAPQVQCPSLVLWGDQDQKTPRTLSQAIADAVPGSVLATIPGAGHLSNLDRPEPFAAAITAFLRSSELLPG